MDIIRGFANLPKITLSTCGRDDDVFVDRLNYKYTTSVLFISSIVITIKILQSDHIQCWVPAILAKYEHYINVYCWISNTYYVSFKEQTTSLKNKPERMLKYYQWVPMILLGMAVFFLLPRFIYRFLSKQSGLDLLNLADAAINYMSVEKFDKRRRSLLYLANSIHFYSVCNKTRRTKDGFISQSSMGASAGTPIIGASSSKPYLYTLLCCHGKLNGSYLTILYMLTKLFYLLNSIAQIFILNIFLGFNYNTHGAYVLLELLKNMFSASAAATRANAYQQQRMKQEADVAAAQFASKLNLNQMPPPVAPIMGPTVIFDSNDDFTASIPGVTSNSAPPYESIYADTIYSEASVNSPLHRYFPRESACDFRIRANIDSLVHNYTVQCVLPINLYNEQLFTLLWAWFWFVCIANAYDLGVWMVRLLPSARYQYIRTRTRLRYSENSVRRQLSAFVYDYLSFDGVFVMRIMSLSMSDCVTHEIIQTLWQNYAEGSGGPNGSGCGGSGGGGGSGGSGGKGSGRPDQKQIAAQRAARYSQLRGSNNVSGAIQGSDGGEYNDDRRYQSSYSNVDNI